MGQTTVSGTVLSTDTSGPEARDALTGILRDGARRMPAAAIENEVTAGSLSIVLGGRL